MQDAFRFEDSHAGSGGFEQIWHDLAEQAARVAEFNKRAFILGEGKVGARIALVGESPGPPDIASGMPFKGPVGEMLDRMLKSIGLERRDCYLTNLVKFVCTSPEITSEWVGFFTPFLQRELKLVNPRLVITFGTNATRSLLQTKQPISQMRGQFYDYEGMHLMPTFNPAYLLRDPMKKREVWEDLKNVRAFLATAER